MQDILTIYQNILSLAIRHENMIDKWHDGYRIKPIVK